MVKVWSICANGGAEVMKLILVSEYNGVRRFILTPEVRWPVRRIVDDYSGELLGVEIENASTIETGSDFGIQPDGLLGVVTAIRESEEIPNGWIIDIKKN